MILLANEKADPYSIVFHADECPETIWDEFRDEDDLQLISEEELSERTCAACWHRWELLLDIIEQCGDAQYYDLAARALADLEYVENFRPRLEEFDAIQWEFACAVRAEIDRLKQQRRQQQEKAVDSSQ